MKKKKMQNNTFKMLHLWGKEKEIKLKCNLIYA